MDTKTVWFENIGSKRVFCILTEPDPSQKKLIIMSHGFRGGSTGPARTFVDFTALLVKNNYSVLRYNQPNSGNSDGEYINSSFKEWVKTLVFLTKKYLNLGYKVSLLGQSMGATTTMIATHDVDVRNKIPCVILWVPDAKSNYSREANKTYEEGGQIYKGTFWQEAKELDFFNALNNYQGAIHLVYGEFDKYVDKDIVKKTIKIVKEKNQSVMILKGQEHSPWLFNDAQKVYEDELNFLIRTLNKY